MGFLGSKQHFEHFKVDFQRGQISGFWAIFGNFGIFGSGQGPMGSTYFDVCRDIRGFGDFKLISSCFNRFLRVYIYLLVSSYNPVKNFL